MKGLFVTATDTGVGKTVVTGALTLALRAEGLDVAVAKPVQSGNLAADSDGDAGQLAGWLGEEPEELVAYAFEAPLAPGEAARLEGAEIAPARLVAFVHGRAAGHDGVLVEGAGGLLVPLAPGFTVADLARELAVPVLVVARPGLGTVNHTALTVEALRARGLRVAGIVLNGRSAETDRSVEGNAGLIEDLTGTPVLGITPRLDGLTPAALAGLGAHLDLAPVRAALGKEERVGARAR